MVTFAAFLVFLAAPQASESLETLADKNQQNLQRIQTLQIEVECSLSQDAGKTWKTMAKKKWAKDGPNERFWSKTYLTVLPNGKWQDEISFDETCYSSNKVMRLRGWDYENPPALPLQPSDSTHKKIRGLIADRPRTTGENVPFFFFFFADYSNNLAELVAKSAVKKLVGKINDDKRQVWAMELEDPNYKFTFVIHLDPQHNYSISKRIITTGEGNG